MRDHPQTLDIQRDITQKMPRNSFQVSYAFAVVGRRLLLRLLATGFTLSAMFLASLTWQCAIAFLLEATTGSASDSRTLSVLIGHLSSLSAVLAYAGNTRVIAHGEQSPGESTSGRLDCVQSRMWHETATTASLAYLCILVLIRWPSLAMMHVQ